MFRCRYTLENIVQKLYISIGSPNILKTALIKSDGTIESRWYINYDDTVDWIKNNIESSKDLISNLQIQSQKLLVIKEIQKFNEIPIEVYYIIIKFSINALCLIPKRRRESKELSYKLNKLFETFNPFFDIEEYLFDYLNCKDYIVILRQEDENMTLDIIYKYKDIHSPRIFLINSMKNIIDICIEINDYYPKIKVLTFIEDLLYKETDTCIEQQI